MRTTAHVVPVNDLIEHEDEDCVCGPKLTPVKSEVDGGINWLYTHHSLDGREANEVAES